MFEITEKNYKKSMHDPMDGSKLIHRGGVSTDRSREIFVLEWNGYSVSLVVHYDRLSDRADDRIHVEIESFGDFPDYPNWKRQYADLGPTTFATRDERDRCELKAVEALVAYGDFYDGPNYPDGKIVIHVREGVNAGTYTLSSFGYDQYANGAQA